MGAGSSSKTLSALLAGAAASVVSTLVQLLLWWGSGAAVADLLLRDTRLTAALLLGPAVLAPAAGFDAGLFLLAGVIHLGLSLCYAALLLPLRQTRWVAALGVGAAFGCALYAVNLYLWTAVFPWFVAARGGVTLVAHIAFGVTVMLVYRVRGGRSRPAVR